MHTDVITLRRYSCNTLKTFSVISLLCYVATVVYHKLITYLTHVVETISTHSDRCIQSFMFTFLRLISLCDKFAWFGLRKREHADSTFFPTHVCRLRRWMGWHLCVGLYLRVCVSVCVCVCVCVFTLVHAYMLSLTLVLLFGTHCHCTLEMLQLQLLTPSGLL